MYIVNVRYTIFFLTVNVYMYTLYRYWFLIICNYESGGNFGKKAVNPSIAERKVLSPPWRQGKISTTGWEVMVTKSGFQPLGMVERCWNLRRFCHINWTPQMSFFPYFKKWPCFRWQQMSRHSWFQVCCRKLGCAVWVSIPIQGPNPITKPDPVFFHWANK